MDEEELMGRTAATWAIFHPKASISSDAIKRKCSTNAK
jgi:hypothetical protein